MTGGLSGSTGIILYNTDKQGTNAVYGYYRGDSIVIEEGTLAELRGCKTEAEKPFKRKDKVTSKIMTKCAIGTLALIVASFLATSFFKGLFLTVLLLCAFFPVVVLLFTNISLYEYEEDFEQFRRYHGCEHACLELISEKKEATLENLKSCSIYDSECGTVYMGYVLTLLAVIAITGLNIGTLGLMKMLGITVATVVILFANIFNPNNPYKVLQKNVVRKPTDKEYYLALELLRRFREL